MIDRGNTSEPAAVLVVEPSAEIARLTRDALSAAGSNVNIHAVSDGADALEFLHQRGEYADAPSPCLVVLRFELPESGPDGLGVLEAITEEAPLRRIPVLVTVESPPPETVVRDAYQLGANAVVSMPTDPEAIVETMEHVAKFWIATTRLPNRIDRL